ncbi:MAG: hypothetical protein R3B48_27065 [Kofleriaceae bacterium]
MIDAPPIDAGPPRCAFSYVDVCGLTPDDAKVYDTPTTIDTSLDASCTHILTQGTGQPELCVIDAPSITVSAPVRGIGARPLVLLARGPMMLSGSVDVSTTRMPVSPGAGALALPCPPYVVIPQAGTRGGGGGAGGSFGGKGGNGGNGNDPGSGGRNKGGDALAAMPAATFDVLRGGCPGQPGADAAGDDAGGVPGDQGEGGGAVYLAASGELTVTATGRVHAGGAGGNGGGALTGAGGAGSGGMIVIEAAAVHHAGVIAANGGGGGEGGVIVSGTPLNGGNGENGQSSAQTAKGGDAFLIADGDGGNGSGGGGTPQAGRNGSNSFDGGGGGGGGAGFIRVLGTRDGAGVISPAPTP